MLNSCALLPTRTCALQPHVLHAQPQPTHCYPRAPAHCYPRAPARGRGCAARRAPPARSSAARPRARRAAAPAGPTAARSARRAGLRPAKVGAANQARRGRQLAWRGSKCMHSCLSRLACLRLQSRLPHCARGCPAAPSPLQPNQPAALQRAQRAVHALLTADWRNKCAEPARSPCLFSNSAQWRSRRASPGGCRATAAVNASRAAEGLPRNSSSSASAVWHSREPLVSVGGGGCYGIGGIVCRARAGR